MEKVPEMPGEGASRGLEVAARSLRARGVEPDFAFFVPGRVELLGKHTDYAGGRSLLAAVERGFTFAGSRSAAPGELLVMDAQAGRELRIPLTPSAWPIPRDWGRYPGAVARRVMQDVLAPGASRQAECGIVLAFASDLPEAAGMSSSSALVVGTFLALATGLELEEHLGPAGAPGADLPGGLGARERLAAYLSAVEAGRPHAAPWIPEGTETHEGGGRTADGGGWAGVGTDGGSGDHTAILASRPGHLVQYRFLRTCFEGAVPLPRGWVLALASSGVRAAKAEGARQKYNRLAEEARAAARVWREATGERDPHLGAILSRADDALPRMEEVLRREGHTALLDRFRQFATECLDLVPGAAGALARGDLDALGDHAARSHALADVVLGNQVPETNHLVAAARERGSPSASAFGAGFGGAVWALVPESGAGAFLSEWRADYLSRFPARAGSCAFLSTGAGPPAYRLL